MHKNMMNSSFFSKLQGGGDNDEIYGLDSGSLFFNESYQTSDIKLRSTLLGPMCNDGCVGEASKRACTAQIVPAAT